MSETTHEIETPPEGITLAAAFLRVTMTIEERRQVEHGTGEQDGQFIDVRRGLCLPGLSLRVNLPGPRRWLFRPRVIRRFRLLFVPAKVEPESLTFATKMPILERA